MNQAEYDEFVRPYARALRSVMLRFEFFVEDIPGIEVHSIHSRIKTYESAIAKSERLGISIRKMRDIAGLRIVVATQSDSEAVARFFTREAHSDDTKVAKDERVCRPDGYRARHIVFEETRGLSYEPVLEVQIVSLVENAFNHISRTWTYKASYDMPVGWDEEFRSVAADLADIDRRIQRLHQAVVSSASEQADESASTPFTFQRMAKELFDEDVTLDDAVDAIGMLGRVGIRTNRQLRSTFTNPEFESLRQDYLAYDKSKSRSNEGFGSQPRHRFFVFVAVRPRAARAYLQKSKKLDRAKERNPGTAQGSYVDLLKELVSSFGPNA